MKTARIVLCGIVAVIMVLAFTGCPTQVEIEPLQAPQIALEGSTVTWAGVDGADEYSIFADGLWKQNLGRDARGLNLAELNLATGPHVVTITAFRTSPWGTSAPSNAVIFTVYPLLAPQITLAGSTITWAGVDRAEGYEVRWGDQWSERRTLGSDARGFNLAELGLAVGDHVVTVVAYRWSTASWSRENSDQSNAIIFNPLPAPQITLTGSTITWTGADEADGYNIHVDGFWKQTLGRDARGLNLAELNLATGPHVVTITASRTSPQGTSAPSNAVIFTVYPLLAPQITLVGSTITWAGVDRAEGFEVRWGDQWSERRTLGSEARGFNLAELGLATGPHVITVLAFLGHGLNWENSDPSNAIIFTVIPLPAPQITLVGSTITWAGVDGAEGYEIRIDGNARAFLDHNARGFNLAGLSLDSGDRIVTVVAYRFRADWNQEYSNPSNAVVFTVTPLPPPPPGII
ncbi:MAG: hypothetical protein FWD88_00600 [Treponema sp.]|nr:hypothetical protein [Treponema sp.]